MTATVTISIDEAKALAKAALIRAGCNDTNANSTASALVRSAADGQTGHGLSRITTYAPQVLSGKVNGKAIPVICPLAPAVIGIDAAYGFAYPAIDLAIKDLPAIARRYGLASAVIKHSHHFGQAGAHVERLADQGLVALVFGNSPAGIAFWGGKTPKMGTNPVAFAAPIEGATPLVIDFATSVAARGKIVAAKRNHEAIPPDWAFDHTGSPTTDATMALEGSMAPLGGPKGAALSLMIEVLAAALTGSHFGFEASSFFEAEGDAPNVGQTIIAIDPEVFSGGAYFARMATLMNEADSEKGVRLPGTSRIDRRANAAEHGLTIPEELWLALSLLGSG